MGIGPLFLVLKYIYFITDHLCLIVIAATMAWMYLTLTNSYLCSHSYKMTKHSCNLHQQLFQLSFSEILCAFGGFWPGGWGGSRLELLTYIKALLTM